jgi:hypothetical protein
MRKVQKQGAPRADHGSVDGNAPASSRATQANDGGYRPAADSAWCLPTRPDTKEMVERQLMTFKKAERDGVRFDPYDLRVIYLERHDPVTSMAEFRAVLARALDEYHRLPILKSFRKPRKISDRP